MMTSPLDSVDLKLFEPKRTSWPAVTILSILLGAGACMASILTLWIPLMKVAAAALGCLGLFTAALSARRRDFMIQAVMGLALSCASLAILVLFLDTGKPLIARPHSSNSGRVTAPSGYMRTKPQRPDPTTPAQEPAAPPSRSEAIPPSPETEPPQHDQFTATEDIAPESSAPAGVPLEMSAAAPDMATPGAVVAPMSPLDIKLSTLMESVGLAETALAALAGECRDMAAQLPESAARDAANLRIDEALLFILAKRAEPAYLSGISALKSGNPKLATTKAQQSVDLLANSPLPELNQSRREDSPAMAQARELLKKAEDAARALSQPGTRYRIESIRDGRAGAVAEVYDTKADTRRPVQKGGKLGQFTVESIDAKAGEVRLRMEGQLHTLRLGGRSDDPAP